MIRLFLPLFLLTFSQTLFSQSKLETINKTSIAIGEQVTFYSEILNEDRTVNLYLPLGYSPDSSKTYPVIYLLDGSLEEDFIHIAGLVQFGSFSWINLIPETIVVGISNVDRKRDFTYPTTIEQDKLDFPTTGGSANFIDFIEKELQPFIDQNYKANKVKTIIGQSLGGLLATEILFKKPDLFDNYVIISPSLWWDNQSLLSMDPKPLTSSKSIFIGVGKEGAIMEKDAKALYKKIVKLKSDQVNLCFEFFKEQDHGDVLHLAAYKAFESIFKI